MKTKEDEMAGYLILDTETTGLDPKTHGLITLSMVVETDSKRKIWNGLNTEWRIKSIDASALKVNNFLLSELSRAPDASWQALDYENFVYSFVDFLIQHSEQVEFLVGMNVQFDISFIKKACEDFNIKIDSLLPRKQIDPLVFASCLKDMGMLSPSIKNINSKSLYDFYEIDYSKGFHSSDQDCKFTWELWQKMKKTFSSKA
jgi:DNA polymerase III epsilon subunit-like protein